MSKLEGMYEPITMLLVKLHFDICTLLLIFFWFFICLFYLLCRRQLNLYRHFMPPKEKNTFTHFDQMVNQIFNWGENCSIIMSLLRSNLITFCNLMTFVKPFWMIPSHLARHRGQFCQPVTALISFFLQHDEWVKSTDEFIYGDSLRTVIHNK